MYRRIFAAMLAAGLAAPFSASADGHAEALEKAVKARQGLFQVYSSNLGQLAAMAKGEAEYDAETAQNAADNLLAAATMKGGAMWPAGSHKAALPGKTRALEKAWTTWPAIGEKSEALKKAAAAMQANAGSLDGIKANIAAVGASCKGCHDEYRA